MPVGQGQRLPGLFARSCHAGQFHQGCERIRSGHEDTLVRASDAAARDGGVLSADGPGGDYAHTHA
ncbi:hypothetical protein MMAD_49530 [Mycolicibacterium madagascariense]|uniref:Uncharacterized protein n=1 Tax=Mycolicibacterium madagascariense TaxID=212765 RepID=A0A7I7XN49_9MYCO|nr:hypothetical protein MMAD_49530 [Mycolicibacterium madagascariense]